MAQVSYGTITITDTTDLTTYIRYATKAPLTAASQFQETPTTDTRYIAVLSISTSDSIPAWNSSSWKWSEFIGTDGLSVKDTRVLYYLKTNSANVPQVDKNTSIVSTDTQNAWTSKNPTYVANGIYWTCLEVILSDNTTKSWSAPAEDLGLTQTAKDTAEAKSIAQQTIEDAQGALSIATGINQHFFSIPSDYSTSVPAGSYITEINIDEFKQSPSGGNLLTRSDGVWLRNGADILASLQGTGLTFLIPTGTYKGRKSLEILGGTTPALKLYDAQNNNAVATLNSNGLVLSKGGIRVNTVGSNNGVYISSENLGSKVTSLDANKINWRAVIGSKFGVDSEGNLYANEAHISGEITASKLTISSNATINDTSGLIRNDAIEVGGRNLLKAADVVKYEDTDSSGTLDISNYETSGTVIYTRGAVSNEGFYVSKYELMEPNTEYTISFKAKCTSGSITKFFMYATNPNNTDTNAIYMNGTKISNRERDVDYSHSITMTNETYYDFKFVFKTKASIATGSYLGHIIQWNKDVATAFTVEMTNLKWEKGNKATDWTPAPEDVKSYTDTAISEVGPQIDEAQTQATEAAKAYSNEILESFSSKFTVSPENISSEVVAIQDGETLVSRINQLPDSVKIEAKNVEIIDKYESYIELAADEANPYILLGKRENNAMLLRITNERMGFEVNSEEVAYLAPDALHVQKQISFGDFIMKQRENGHLSIIRTTRGGD